MRVRSKKKRSQARISEVEKRIDDVYSLLQTGLAQQNTPAPRTPEHKGVLQQPLETSPVDSGLGYPVDVSPFPHGFDHSNQVDVIQKRIVPIQEAERLVSIFKTDFGSFPFVLIPDLTIESFRRERPALFLSVLTTASQKQLKLQESLEQELREVLSNKIIVEGAKDLDLLQGLLVYLAWYHSHFKLQAGQLHMLVQIALAMTIEMDLGKSTQSSAEAKRAFVGTYYLSSCLSMINRKPITMKYNDQIGECCQSLAAEKEAPSDNQLVHFVNMQRLSEEIALVFDNDPLNDEKPRIGSERADLLIKAFKPRLQHLRDSFPQDGTCLPSLLLQYDSACIRLHQVSLHVYPDKSVSEMSDPELLRTSGVRMNLLVGCLEATRSLLDRYLQLSPYVIEHHSLMEKSTIAYAITVLIKLAFCTNPGTEPFPLRHASSVPYYLDALGALVGSISVTAAHAAQHDSFRRFTLLAERVKAWYERAQSLEPTSFFEMKPSELKGPLQLVEIAKIDDPLFNFDMGNLDFLLVEGNNIWEGA